MYQKLCKLMEQRGETAYQVSKATGISQSAFSNWKAGNTKPGTKNLAALAKHFYVPMEYFMVEEPVEQGKGGEKGVDFKKEMARYRKKIGTH